MAMAGKLMEIWKERQWSCLKHPLNFASLENLTLAEGEEQHQEGELITKYYFL